MTELVTSGSVGGMASNGRLYPETALIHNQLIDLRPGSTTMERHLSGERATPPSARTGRRLAALQLVGIACYSASSFERLRRSTGSTVRSHLARHPPVRTLGGVQLPPLG